MPEPTTPDPALGSSCPKCGVSAGYPCRRPSGETTAPHKARALPAQVQGVPNLETR